jgi:hypothetical protein
MAKCLWITFIMAGNAVLGPLAENAATLGDRTPLPTTLKVREILTTGILHATTLDQASEAGHHQRNTNDELVSRPW